MPYYNDYHHCQRCRLFLLTWHLVLLLPRSYCVWGFSSLIDIANMALKQSPSSTRFITNTMCPFAQKAWLALEVSKLPYEMEEISLYGRNGKPDWFLKLNPKGTVPVVVANGGAVVFPDSDVILDQFETKTNTTKAVLQGSVPLYPPADRQDVRTQIEEWRKRINAMLPDGKQAVLSGKLTSKLDQHLQGMEDAVIEPYLASQRCTTADCHAFPFVWRLAQEYSSEFPTQYPKLSKWLQFCAEQPSFATTIQSSWWWWW